MYGYNAEPPIAIPIYTVLPYCVILCDYTDVNRRFAVVDGTAFFRHCAVACVRQETGDRTEKTSCQNVDVCRRVQNHLSNRDS